MNKNMVRVTYGLSMYGGWYANFFTNGGYQGIHAGSKEALIILLDNKFGKDCWQFGERYDN